MLIGAGRTDDFEIPSMTSTKQLDGVAHDLGHHSQSSMSLLHPHVGEACRRAQLTEVSVNLLSENPYPAVLPHSHPLALALAALRNWFSDLLHRKGFDETDVQSATLIFQFRVDRKDDYSCGVLSTIVSRSGKVYSHKLKLLA
jgi:hypothetical protein